jgi:arylsulfatase A-like enzyme
MSCFSPTRVLTLTILAAVAALAVHGGGAPVGAQSPPVRPNIVMVVVDDMRWDDMGVAGHPFVETPNIDRVAREGARFANAFATTPLCSPSRGNLLTGLYAHTSGIVDNVERGPASHQLDTFPRMLQRAGYDTAFIGKWHMGNDDTPRPGWDYWLSMKGQGQLFDPPLNENGERKVVKGYITDIFSEKAAAFIERPRTKPFLVYLPHKAIHPDLTVKLPEGQQALVRGGFLAAPRHEGRYAEAKVPRRTNYGVTPTDKPALMRAVEGVTPISLDTVTPDETIRDRLEMLLSIDDGLGTMLSALERVGKLDDTIVVFTSDHGYFYGEHGLNAERRFAYEESIRIPLVARYPRLIKPGTIPEQLTLTIDLAPTLLELGRAPVPQALQGRSLVPLLRGERPKDWRTSVLIEHHSDPERYLGRGALRRALNMGYKAVRTERHKYIQYTELSGMDELYDLQSDPYEMNNLFANPQRAPTLQAMRDELTRLLRETGGQARP